MPDLPREGGSRRQLTILRKHQESNTMLAIAMAGIAALFIVAIVAAYNYASGPSTALDSNPPASASSTVSRSPTETTGSGSNAPPPKALTDKTMKQQ